MPFKCIFILHHHHAKYCYNPRHKKTPSLSKNLKTLLPSLAVSDLGVGLVAQPLYVARLIMASKLNIETSKTYNAIYIAYLIATNLFIFATLFLVIVLCAERFIAIHY